MPSLPAGPLLREVAGQASAKRSSQQRFRDEALALIERESLAEPALSFSIVDLEEPAAETLRAGDERFYAPKLLPQSGRLTALACGVATVGPRVEARVGALFRERSMSLGLALDEVANELLFAVSRRLQDRMLLAARKSGLNLAGELRPGDPGLALNAQAGLLRLADAESIGVGLFGGHMLNPIKSVSVMFGAGVDLPAVRWSRCDECSSRATCKIAPRELVDA
ncbi:MAG: hypothetical protein RO009_14760 [Pseudorhodoplanes sp.]|jgi:hypothetical protein|nr:hypothetical protein [Pseudorhodoplanes sp.]